jgi:lysophospholipase L1-like esterase
MNDQKRAGLAMRICAAGLSSLVALGLLEIFVRMFIPVRDVGPAFTVYDPFYGKRMHRNFQAKRVAQEFQFELTTNSLGMRDPEPASPPVQGVMFIGDSFTMGLGVQDTESFPALVRARLNERGLHVPVLNIGMGNNGNGRWLKFLRRDAARFQPRLVILQVMENDFRDNRNERLFALSERGKLQELAVAEPSFGRRVQGVVDGLPGLSYSYLVGLAWAAADGRGLQQMLAGAAVHPVAAAQEAKKSPGDELTYALVAASIDRAQALGADVLGLFVELTGLQRARMAEVFEARGVKFLDGPSKLKAPDLFFVVDGHWNAKGHRKVAELMAPEIEQRLRPR